MLKKVTQYSVPTYDKPGALAKITDALALKGYNISGVSTESMGDVFVVRFVADSDDGIAEALKSKDFHVLENAAFCMQLANKPGQLSEIAKSLGDSGVNVRHAYCTTSGAGAKLVLTCDDPDKAYKILAKLAAKAGS